MSRERRETLLSLLFVGALVALCATLAVLQYRWLGEVSMAARDRLKGSLRASMNRMAMDLNSDIAGVCRLLVPVDTQDGVAALEREIADRFEQLHRSNRNARLLARVGIAVTKGESVSLALLNPAAGKFEAATWPNDWTGVREHLEARGSREPWSGRGPLTPDGLVIEAPLFSLLPPNEPGPKPGRPPEPVWLVVQLDGAYLRDTVLPALLNRHLGDGKGLEYQVAVFTRATPPALVYESEAGISKTIVKAADDSIGLMEVDSRQIVPRFQPGRGRWVRDFGGAVRSNFRRGPMPAGEAGLQDIPPGPPMQGRGAGPGRWQMYARHRAGSLEAVVARARLKNLAVAGGVLLLLLTSVAALIRFTRRAQKLAQLQMEFVAGVSHELRTPLTVIHTAGFNLRGRIAQNPAQVERYGELIQKESGRLKDLVEQILQFARMQAGHVIHRREPVSVAEVVERVLEADRAALDAAGCTVEKSVADGLPWVSGDAVALQHALENLLNNALKYGTAGSNWIGVNACRVEADGREWIELRVTDHGHGIPKDEQRHIFDPFYRGRRAREDQVHGSGLGLNLAMRIVRAHGGTISVKSEPMKGAEFVVRLPAAPAEVEDELANTAG